MISHSEFQDFLVRNKEFAPSVAAEILGGTEEEVAQLMAKFCREGQFYNDLWYKVKRRKNWVWEQRLAFRRNIHVNEDVYRSYFSRDIDTKKQMDAHLSTFGHDLEWVEDTIIKGRVAGVTGKETYLAYLWIEMDRKDEEHPLYAGLSDAVRIIERHRIHEHALIYWSGNNSVHLCIHGSLFGNIVHKPEVMTGFTGLAYKLALRVAGDVRHRNGVLDPHALSGDDVATAYQQTFRRPPLEDVSLMIRALENIDPNIYHPNASIRQPFSIHPKTGGRKLPMTFEMAKKCLSRKVIDDGYVKSKFKEGKAAINIIRKSQYPLLFPLVLKAREDVTVREKLRKKIVIDKSQMSYIMQVYSELLNMALDESMANEDGWMGDFYNPFYEDQSPSMRINVFTGQLVDYGSDEYRNLSFSEVLALKEQIGYVRSALRWQAIKNSELYESSFKKKSPVRVQR